MTTFDFDLTAIADLRSRELIGRCLPVVLQKYDEILAVMLFGSRAKGRHDEKSDIDLLVVLKNGVPDLRRFHIEEVSIDCMAFTQERILKSVEKRSKGANNFFIEIFYYGIVLSPFDSFFSEFLENMKSRWEQGPPIIEGREAKKIIRNITETLHSAKIPRLTNLSASADERAIFRMQLDQAVRKSIAAYFRITGRWTSDQFGFLSILREEKSALYDFWTSYISNENNDIERSRIATMLVGYVVKMIEEVI